MTFEIKKVSEVVNNSYVNVLLYGVSGVGKTVACSTAPEPLILSAEDGLLSLADLDIDVAEVKTLKDTISAYNYLVKELKEGTCQYKTVCIDSLSELALTLLAEYKAEERDPRKAYMRMAEEIISLVRKFRALPIHVVFVAKQARTTDEFSGKTSYGPSFPGRVLELELAYHLDEVLALAFFKKDGKEFRVLRTSANIQYDAKDRSGKLAELEKPDLTKLFDKILGGTNELNPTEK